jgi:hypothetical protein
MPVAMVKVGPVLVLVLHGLVPVLVRVPGPSIDECIVVVVVGVGVVTVVVPMSVGV